MIYTVTFNPSLDYIVDVPGFETDKVNRTSKEMLFPGGKGVNVSIVLKHLGEESTALGFTAGFTGSEIERLLRKEEVRTDFIPVPNGFSRINMKIRSGVETEVNGQGPAISEMEIKELYRHLDHLTSDDTLVLAGSIPSVMPETMYMDIMKHLEGRGIRIAVDATRDLLMNVLPLHPFVVKPNHHELGEIFGLEINTWEEAVPSRSCCSARSTASETSWLSRASGLSAGRCGRFWFVSFFAITVSPFVKFFQMHILILCCQQVFLSQTI